MAVANYNRKILDLKRWSVLPAPAPAQPGVGSFITSGRFKKQRQFYMANATTHYIYEAEEDGWVQIPSGAFGGIFGAGACGACAAQGPTGSISAVTGDTITTNLSFARSLESYEIEISAGPGAGQRRTIRHNSIGASSTLTVSAAWTTTPTTASTFRLLTPRWYVLNAGSVTTGSFRVYDFATNVWTTLSNTGLPASWITDGKLVGTPSIDSRGPVSFATGTASAGGTSSLTNAAKTWATNQWANFQIRIASGTGAGQIRTIASNTATVITTSTAWAVTPDATSVYFVEGNDDFLYLIGNAAVTIYRYQISTNTWTTLAPIAARAAAPNAALSAHWVYDETKDVRWPDESNIINGRRIYSFRGGASAALDYYDIAANTWISAVAYSPAVETFTAGTKYTYNNGNLYIQKEVTGRWFRYNFAEQSMIGWSTNIYPSGGASIGDTAFDITESETGVTFIYVMLNSLTLMMRCMVI